jgi:trehalose-6-phosphate synthase
MNDVVFINYKNSTTGTGGVGTTSRDMLAKYPDLHFIFWDGSRTLRSADLSIKTDNEKQYFIHNNYSKPYLWQILHGMTVNVSEDNIFEARSIIIKEKPKLAKSIYNFAHKKSNTPIYWVNDYTSFFLVYELRKLDKASTIIFSFRTPFGKNHYPFFFDGDKTLFMSILSADTITFHRNIDKMHFIDFVKNSLDKTIDFKNDSIIMVNHTVTLKVLPEGNNKAYRRSLLKSPKTAFFANYFKMQYGDKPIIASVSRFEFSKGIDYQLDLIEYLLKHHPELVGKFYFFAYTYLSNNKKQDKVYFDFFDEIKKKATKINKIYGNKAYSPVALENRKLNDYEVTGLLSQASILLVPSYADGFNHVVSEAIFTHDISHPVQIVLGDIGVSDYIKGYYRLEHNLLQDSRTLTKTLKASAINKKIRFVRLTSGASKLSSEVWFDSILRSAKKIKERQK